ncbi:hypothetical protein CDD83_1560 [Cordyceps sp. RAO-2017]|nr:hypothetical protein CDD83_1560 [Cordyceps sp. RAO-2017]
MPSTMPSTSLSISNSLPPATRSPVLTMSSARTSMPRLTCTLTLTLTLTLTRITLTLNHILTLTLTRMHMRTRRIRNLRLRCRRPSSIPILTSTTPNFSIMP